MTVPSYTQEPQIAEASSRRTLFSRDINYLRDSALFWPFVFSSIFAVAGVFSGRERQIGLRCAILAAISLLLSKEKLMLFLVSLGFIAIQCGIHLLLKPWSWEVFIAGILTATPFLLANRYWRKPKLAYRLPREFRLVDALWSIGSLCCTLILFYFISPYN